MCHRLGLTAPIPRAASSAVTCILRHGSVERQDNAVLRQLIDNQSIEVGVFRFFRKRPKEGVDDIGCRRKLGFQMRPERSHVEEVLRVPATQLHQEHITERGSQHLQLWGVEHYFTRFDVESRGSKRLGVIVQPIVRQVVALCDSTYRLAQIVIEPSDRVDVSRCFAQTVPSEQRPANDDDDMLLFSDKFACDFNK